VRGLAHITGGGLLNLRRIGAGVGYSITAPLPSPPVFELIAQFGEISPAEMWEVFNMGCGLVAMVPADQADAAVDLLTSFHPSSAVIGTITDRDDLIEVVPMGIRAEPGIDKLVGA
jgi:phosphoribosylformylglycinamidine cyclo-ligase